MSATIKAHLTPIPPKPLTSCNIHEKEDEHKKGKKELQLEFNKENKIQ